MPSAKQSTKEWKGKEWEELYCHFREMNKSTGAKKPSESQKAKALWAMKAAKDIGEVSVIQPVKKTFWEEQRQPRFCERIGKGRFGKASGLACTRGTVCTCAQPPLIGTFQGSMGRMASFIKKEPMVASNDVSSNPFVSAETLEACALVGLHLLAAEGDAGSCGGQSPDLGDMWRHCCPISPEWISSCSASETSH